MAFYNLLIFISWLTLIASWVLLARYAKRSVGGRWQWPRELGVRFVILILVLLAFHLLGAHSVRRYAANANPIAGYVGAALCAFGVSLAVWARVRLGTNWGVPMAKQARAELITQGPYASIRHPIYTGIILALLGSAIGQTVLWTIPLFLLVPYFIYSARREEKLMSEQFPHQYPAYIKHTHMFIPFIA